MAVAAESATPSWSHFAAPVQPLLPPTAQESYPHGHSLDIDVTDPQSVAEAVTRAHQDLGWIDILVNAAGVSSERYWQELDLVEWRRVLDINLTGTYLVCNAMLPAMMDRGSGRIINIASQLAIKGAPALAHYCASKAGVLGYTKALAIEAASHGVLVNAVAPGPVNTPLIDRMSETWRHRKASELPLGRFGDPDEFAPTVVLLASDPGGNLYVGQTLGPNSGDVMPWQSGRHDWRRQIMAVKTRPGAKAMRHRTFGTPAAHCLSGRRIQRTCQPVPCWKAVVIPT